MKKGEIEMTVKKEVYGWIQQDCDDINWDDE